METDSSIENGELPKPAVTKMEIVEDVDRYMCKKCGKPFICEKSYAENYNNHILSKAKKTNICNLCKKSFTKLVEISSHLNEHSDNITDVNSNQNTTDKMHDSMILESHIIEMHDSIPAKSLLKKKKLQLIKCKKITMIGDYLCKPNGCKLIQCMICLTKLPNIFSLRYHIRTHETTYINFKEHTITLSQISYLLYPNQPVMTEKMLIERISNDIGNEQYDNFYSITNEAGYELNIESSETESDVETDDIEIYRKRNQKYTCELCWKSFNRKYQLFEHQKTVHEWLDAPHVCEHCDMRFVSIVLLNYHYSTQCKNPNKRFVCDKCMHRFRWRENFKFHTRTKHKAVIAANKTNKNSTFDCSKCSRSFSTIKFLNMHMVMHRNENDLIKCLWCTRKFSHNKNLLKHIARHGITEKTLETAKCIIKATSTAKGSKHIFCKLCNLQFTSIVALREHFSTQLHPNGASLRNYSIMNSLGFESQIDDSDTDNDNENQRHYTCVICNLTCKRKYELGKHQHAMHKPENLPLKCDKCIFKTVSPAILKHHMETQCNNVDKMFECDKCFFKFMWEENLQIHNDLLHKTKDITLTANLSAIAKISDEMRNSSITSPNANKFQCDYCDHNYKYEHRLLEHIKKNHTIAIGIKKTSNEKIYLCTICGKTVASQANFKVHMRRHTGEKPYKCDFCEMAFPFSSQLQIHRRKHTGEKPHKCTVCEKSFRTASALQRHMAAHSDERPYECTYCVKKFKRKSELSEHTQRHTGERPYGCSVCGQHFIRVTLLNQHCKKHNHYEDKDTKIL